MDKLIEHLDMIYHEIPIEDCLGLVHELIKEGREWHSHALSPGCRFNPYDDLYAVMIEDSTSNKIFIASSVFFPEVDKKLVTMLHGENILSEDSALISDENVCSSELLQRVVELNERKAHWHHHMNFPKCLMTPHTDKWMITVETDSESFEEEYDEEPKEILNHLEVIYFKNFDGK